MPHLSDSCTLTASHSVFINTSVDVFIDRMFERERSDDTVCIICSNISHMRVMARKRLSRLRVRARLAFVPISPFAKRE